MDLDGAMAKFVEDRTIPIFGIANVEGFADALPGWHPKELMPKCNSVVVFGHPFFEYPLHIEERTYIANRSWWDANRIVYRQVATWKRELFGLFDGFGLGVAGFGGFRLTTLPTFILHLKDRTVESAGGAGMYTAMAARRCGVQTVLFGPRPDPCPEPLEPVAKHLTEWLGPSISPGQLLHFEISYRGGKPNISISRSTQN